MSDQPTFGQRQENYEWIACYRHPREQAISQCKRCQNHTCLSCTIPTEVATLCPACGAGTAAMETPTLRVVSSGKAGGNGSAHANFSIRRFFRGHSTSKGFSTTGTSFSGRTLGGLELTYTNLLIIGTIIISSLGMLFPLINGYLAFNPAWAYYQPWRFLTVMLVHGGLMHLLLNMYSLYLVGNALETSIGFARTLGIYLASVLGGSLFSLAWTVFITENLSAWTVGASGGIFGLFATVYVIQRNRGLDSRAMGLLLGINLLVGFLFPGISWQGHLGGLLVGGILSSSLWHFARLQPGYTPTQVRNRNWLVFTLTYLLLAAATMGCYMTVV